jgi:hypothetical protein
MLAERVVEWTEQLKQQGLQQGKLEGEAAVLERLLCKRFGALTGEATRACTAPRSNSSKAGRTGGCWMRPHLERCLRIIEVWRRGK